jgi:hypothetical protein
MLFVILKRRAFKLAYLPFSRRFLIGSCQITPIVVYGNGIVLLIILEEISSIGSDITYTKRN